MNDVFGIVECGTREEPLRVYLQAFNIFMMNKIEHFAIFFLVYPSTRSNKRHIGHFEAGRDGLNEFSFFCINNYGNVIEPRLLGSLSLSQRTDGLMSSKGRLTRR